MHMDVIMNMTVYNSAYTSWMLSYAYKTGWTRKNEIKTYMRNVHITPVTFGSRWLCLVRFSSEKFQFYEYQMCENVRCGKCDSYITLNSIIFRNIV